IRDPERHPFSTPSGKIEIYSMTLAADPDPCGLGTIPPIPTWIPDDADPRHADQRHPLRLVTPKSRARTPSIHANQPLLRRADAESEPLTEERAGFAGVLPSDWGCGGHVGAPTQMSPTRRMTEERTSSAGALRAGWGCGGHVGAPTQTSPACSKAWAAR